jgi:hypothetical protein
VSIEAVEVHPKSSLELDALPIQKKTNKSATTAANTSQIQPVASLVEAMVETNEKRGIKPRIH